MSTVLTLSNGTQELRTVQAVVCALQSRLRRDQQQRASSHNAFESSRKRLRGGLQPLSLPLAESRTRQRVRRMESPTGPKRAERTERGWRALIGGGQFG